jgi:AcrR family transcriptional regulator
MGKIVKKSRKGAQVSTDVPAEEPTLTEGLTEKQSQVLEAAIDVFGEKGFARASTSEIAKRAGVAEGTLFKRYATKKDLLLEIGLFIASKIPIPLQAKEMQELFSRPYDRFEDLLRTVLKNRLEFALKNQRLLRVVVQEMPFHPELQRLFIDAAQQKVIPVAVAAIDRFKKAGQLRDLPAPTILRAVVSQFFSYVLLRVLIAPNGLWNDEKEMEHIISIVMSGLGKS